MRRYARKNSLLATAVIERFFLSLKSEHLWRVPVSLCVDVFRQQLSTYVLVP